MTCRKARLPVGDPQAAKAIDDEIAIGRMLSAIEDAGAGFPIRTGLDAQGLGRSPPVPQIPIPPDHASGRITGTGGAGKSSVTDELLNRFPPASRRCIAVISIGPDPVAAAGGALLGDRVRMNSLRSTACSCVHNRHQHVATNAVLKDCIAFLKVAGLPTSLSSRPPASAERFGIVISGSISRCT